MSGEKYAEMDLNALRIHKTPSMIIDDKEAVSKKFVDRVGTTLQNTINTESDTRQQQNTVLDENKFDKSTKYTKRYDGSLAVSEDSYLYIGNAWRITANNIGQTRKLILEYTEDGIAWNVGLPFIHNSPTIPTSITQIIPDTPSTIIEVVIHIYNNKGHPMKLVCNKENLPVLIDETKYNANSNVPYQNTLEERKFKMHYNSHDDNNNRIYDIENCFNSDFGKKWYLTGPPPLHPTIHQNQTDVTFSSGTPEYNHFQISDITILSTKTFKSKVRLAGFGNNGHNYIGTEEPLETDQNYNNGVSYSTLVSESDSEMVYFTIV